ncbi:hypothetical protein PM082_004516 [Marasmius tenuissimus]|nr:hypothetical protein PM082_004516 [Marasmius tenuissimus]
MNTRFNSIIFLLRTFFGSLAGGDNEQQSGAQLDNIKQKNRSLVVRSRTGKTLSSTEGSVKFI